MRLSTGQPEQRLDPSPSQSLIVLCECTNGSGTRITVGDHKATLQSQSEKVILVFNHYILSESGFLAISLAIFGALPKLSDKAGLLLQLLRISVTSKVY